MLRFLKRGSESLPRGKVVERRPTRLGMDTRIREEHEGGALGWLREGHLRPFLDLPSLLIFLLLPTLHLTPPLPLPCPPPSPPSQLPLLFFLSPSSSPSSSPSLGGVSFIKPLIPFMRALPSGPNHLPRALPPFAIPLRTRFQYMNGGIDR